MLQVIHILLKEELIKLLIAELKNCELINIIFRTKLIRSKALMHDLCNT